MLLFVLRDVEDEAEMVVEAWQHLAMQWLKNPNLQCFVLDNSMDILFEGVQVKFETSSSNRVETFKH